MDKIKFRNIIIISVILFSLLTIIYYKQTQDNAINNAKSKINELLLHYKAFRNYVGLIQKEEVYRLQEEGKIDPSYFNPALLSSTFAARNVNYLYNELKEKQGKKPIEIHFASTNPRNPLNMANEEEAKLLKQFNNSELEDFTKIIDDEDGKLLYYVLPTKPTTQRCMRCHSDPKIAPKGLIEIYGNKNGFHEEVGRIRAVLSTRYPLDDDLAVANRAFIQLTLITFLIFVILLIIVYKFMEKVKKANRTLDDKIKERTQELLAEKEYIKTILDHNPSIIIVINDGEILNANSQFYSFFEVEDLSKKENPEDIEQNLKITHIQQIEEYFLDFDEKRFPEDKKIDSKVWYEYLVEEKYTSHNVSIDFQSHIYTFVVNAKKLNQKGDIVITLQNITDQIEKDKLLFEHSKLASMGEMIGNIAHQWRQPLSIISTSATGMLIQKQYDLLSDEQFEKSCHSIDENAQYLSKTIDDFSNFIKGDREKVHFNLAEHIEVFLQLINSSVKTYHIKIVKDVNTNIYLDGYTNELVQCFINIFNNAKDVLKNIDESDRLFLVTAEKENENIVIKLTDNAGGIPTDVLPRIFEPYFTTKHKAQGTGIGLHMTYNMIVDGMHGNLEAKNVKYRHDGVLYKGAEFKITLPKIIL